MSPKTKRQYSSPVRQRQMAVTRERIVAAAASLLAEDSDGELSHEIVAGATGLATRTVYRHFPTATDLLDAVWEELDRRLCLSEMPATNSGALVEFVSAMFARLDNNAKLVETLLAAATRYEMSRRTVSRRRRAIDAALASDARGMSRAERARLTALVRVLTSPLTWHALRQDRRLTPDGPATTVVWALRQLIAVTGRQRV